MLPRLKRKKILPFITTRQRRQVLLTRKVKPGFHLETCRFASACPSILSAKDFIGHYHLLILAMNDQWPPACFHVLLDWSKPEGHCGTQFKGWCIISQAVILPKHLANHKLSDMTDQLWCKGELSTEVTKLTEALVCGHISRSPLHAEPWILYQEKLVYWRPLAILASLSIYSTMLIHI